MSGEGNLKQGAVISATNRFVRGRGRNSRGNRRPYYYWKKRSTFPNAGHQGLGSGSSTTALLLTNNSLERSAFFTAPGSSDDRQIQIIPIVNPPEYPGWRLYFPEETFIQFSPMVAKIKAFEAHIIKNSFSYALENIRNQQWFFVYAEVLSIDEEFQSSWINFSQELMETPTVVLSSLGLAMHSVVSRMAIKNTSNIDNELAQYCRKIRTRKIHARPLGFVSVTSIDDIKPESYDRLFVVQGCVESITSGETKCTWVAYKCKRCGYEQAIRQGDYYPTKPLRCRIECNAKKNFIEMRSSPYTKVDCTQMIQLQETWSECTLERPNRIDIEVGDDLVDLVCCGSDIIVTGILKMKSLDISRNQDIQTATKQNTYIQAVSIIKKSNSRNTLYRKPTQKDVEIVQMIKKEPNSLRLLVQSFAPEMCGHEMAKFAVLLSLVGGSGSQLHDEGELHILLVGDPGVGKSILLENAASISDKGKLVTRKTPKTFVTNIQQMKMPTGLNAGYFIDTGSILASHAGHCCIDDIDKLSSNQETLVHVIQAKLITARTSSASFNAVLRTSVLAAVNPSSGHYESSKLLRENVHLSPSFLSLFHMVFVLFDKADRDKDNLLAEHVKALHSGIKKVLSIPSKYDTNVKPNDLIPENKEIQLDERLKVECDEQLDLLPAILLKKYIEYSRHTVKPLLTKEAADKIKDFYFGLRSEKNDEQRFLVTTRQLEGLIRLTQARARIDLCSEVTEQHTSDVFELFRHSYADTTVIDRLNSTLNGSIAGTSQGSQVKKFIKVLQLRSNALGRNVFEFEEIKDMASHAGIRCGVANLVDVVNTQGYLLKKGPNLYEVISQ